MQSLVADIVGCGIEAAEDVETVVELVAAVVAVTEESALGDGVGSPRVLVASVLHCELQTLKSIVLKTVLLTARFWLYNGRQKMGC